MQCRRVYSSTSAVLIRTTAVYSTRLEQISHVDLLAVQRLIQFIFKAPLFLPLFSLLPSPATTLGRLMSVILYISLDILSADCLYEIAASGVAVASSAYTSPRRGDGWKPVSVAAVYLFNPFTLLTCLGRPTTVFTTFFVLLSVRHASQGKPTTTAFALALASYTSLHPMLLLPPIGLLCYDQVCKNSTPPAAGKDSKTVGQTASSKPAPLQFILSFIGPFLATTTLLLLLSRLILPSFTFLRSLYLTPLSLPDLTPNPGLWWYFFTEMFDPFRSFFLGVLWLHMLAYSVPFTIRLRAQPLAAVIAMYGVLAIFQPYANVGEVGSWLATTSLMSHVFSSKLETLTFQRKPDILTFQFCSYINPPLPLPGPRGTPLRHSAWPGFPLPVAVRRQRQRQLLLRHHAGVEPGFADPRDGLRLRGFEG